MTNPSGGALREEAGAVRREASKAVAVRTVRANHVWLIANDSYFSSHGAPLPKVLREEKEARTKQVCNDSRRHDAKEKTSRAGKEQRELGTQLLGPKGLTTHTRQVRTADTAGAMHGASKRPG